ncbi:DNA mismatch repair endonuclease MutL [Pradoshia sp. D12]|uniref:DNA mismatch repair endonuclease MutL n=1 Tax=Bacillaceae TaxID=186817 RepID=UPI0011272D07|nr:MULTISPECIES: DNA mismatch repair endonuclease MutL [Bacillaceae]QFK71237.1 DNA mismatch repair endonuclease MutL [Pradoshia sp. D12]TPF73030.1 DNA mismatch repair endonuclease MutL [Bacillus sp. D12]
MGKIVLLDDLLSNKIAAGEVVERPASVVKELVENSIDANSTVIEIYATEAGLESIRIIDNGEGMEEDDALNAFHRHATSKIKDENDLFRIRTLGFRGEALPSIASVSKFELKTSTGDGPGTRLLLEGGKVLTHESYSSRKGTDITVSELFFNTPARLKYVKSVHTELGNITDVVNRLALSHPDVSFKLVHNDRTLLQTSGNGNPLQVLAGIYGIQTAQKMLPFEASTLDFSIKGYAGHPEMTRASRNYMTILVNGRFIKNYLIAKAVMEGYHTLLPIGRYPIAMLNIEMDPLLVDVNVHPSKMEVRFSKEQELMTLISEAIRNTFKKETLIPTGAPVKREEKAKMEQAQFTFTEERAKRPEAPKQTPPMVKATEGFSVIYDPPEIEQPKREFEAPSPIELNEPGRESVEEQVETEPFISSEAGSERVGTIVEQKEEELEPIQDNQDMQESRIPPLYPIGQLHGTYILAQNEQGLYMIDQHAAQERIKYEFFKHKVGEVNKELQEMLVPMTLEYSTDEFVKLEEHKEELEAVGVFLEPFGLNSYIVRAHPTWFPAGMEETIIDEMVHQVLTMKKVDIKKLREEAAIMMSCKGSIKANRHLRNDEISALLDELRHTNDPFTCPHGRPIIVHYSIYELEKMFKRVM